MANPFLSGADRDIETAIIFENSYQHDIGNAVAYTDGDRVFINTDNNLYKILPAYDNKMLKWLLWHERYHKELRHHNRFFKYLHELDEKKTLDEFQVTKEEVNIIMDILVHDSLAKLFPELVEIAKTNLAQFRNRNSLKYTFKSFVLEDMLEEYREYKKKTPEEKEKEKEKETSDTSDTKKSEGKSKSKGGDPKEGKVKEGDKKGHAAGSSGHTSKSKKEDTSEIKTELPDEHEKTDWSKLDKVDSREFITHDDGDMYIDQINKLKRTKLKLGKLTETLNGLVTSTRQRTYAMPSSIQAIGGAVLKGSRPGYTKLYLCFDASGSMSGEMQMFKDIISKSIPQAMNTPTAWFSGYGEKIKRDPKGRSDDYYKGTFNDFMPVYADSGYSDDGDRTIELCWLAEQQGYSPIGITDGGGRLSWSKNKLKELKRTILVGQNSGWLEEVRKINQRVQIIEV